MHSKHHKRLKCTLLVKSNQDAFHEICRGECLVFLCSVLPHLCALKLAHLQKSRLNESFGEIAAAIPPTPLQRSHQSICGEEKEVILWQSQRSFNETEIARNREDCVSIWRKNIYILLLWYSSACSHIYIKYVSKGGKTNFDFCVIDLLCPTIGSGFFNLQTARMC